MAMKKEIIYRAMGEIDPDLLDNFDQTYHRTPLESGKGKDTKGKSSLKILQVAACLVLLMGAGVANMLQREFTGGDIFQWHNEDKQGYSYERNTTPEEVYEEREDGFYYIFQGAEVEISSYCSDSDYFLAPVLDENGTGYVLVIGGEKGARGFLLKHFEEGTFFIGHGYNEIYGSEISWKPNEDEPDIELASSYPQLVWNHHATHLLGHRLSPDWFGRDLPEMLPTNLGEAQKIDGDYFYVQGEALGFYLPYEQSNYIYEELFFLRRMNPDVDWLKNMAVTAPIDIPVVEVVVQDDWTAEREALLREILDETGVPYSLEFVGVHG